MEKESTSFRERDERSASPKATRCSSPNLRLRYAQTRPCSARSTSPNKNAASPKGGSVTPFCAETPSSSTGSQIAHPVKPKDFRVPLTCFFWYHTGSCKKSDNKCFYAHYHTGTVAEPPISFNGRAMGGTRAKNMLGSITQREEELSVRGAEIVDGEQRLVAAQADLEERLNAMIAREQHVQQREEAIQQREEAIQQREQRVQQHEHAVQQREQALQERGQTLQQREQALHQREQSQQHKRSVHREQAIPERETTIAAREHRNLEREQAFATFEEGMLRQLEANYTGIASTVTQMRRAVGNAQGILNNRRQQVLYHENFGNSVQGIQGQSRYGGSIAIDGAIGALAGLDQMLAQGELTLHTQIHSAIKRQ
ncbi:hypothetical protein QM012_000326 [Aureobasidium pullulans]|uniref:C3H1-type domain-containing protein n=1 Tax=Aureobasidium pullulans TaxID=5580 RepID=A0ABR0TVI0_AURPU